MTGRYLIYNLNLKQEETVLDKDLLGISRGNICTYI